MKLSFNWLKGFVDIPKSVTAEELGMRLTMHTVEVEKVEREKDKFKNVVVGKILEIKKHPNADKLQLVKIDIGLSASSGQSRILNIVCGASNIIVGQLVPAALVGATLPSGMEIKKVEVRGEKSNGMLCSPRELGLGEDHSRILILDKKAKIGQNLAEYLGLKDTVFELDNKSITHRPDLWSHYGIAREISAFLGCKFKKYNANAANLNANAANKKIKLDVKVEDFDLCPRYMAIAIDGIKIEPSPKWLEERLIAAGMRPLNNIVDITNYVMLELGQPLHAFDASLIGNEIVIRQAKKGEIIETLDAEKRELEESDLLITDGKKAVAIAGVMGGANSEITNESKIIILESANFNYISIRKTSQRLGLRTESSMRFEKGLDPNLCEVALIRAIELIKKLCPKAKVASNLADFKKYQLNQGPIELSLDRLEKLIGDKIEKNKVVQILTSLGFGVETPRLKVEAYLRVTIPTWRATRDISIPEDLVEEVARIYGYGRIKPAEPRVEMKQPEINEERMLERKIKSILTGAPALTEVYNYSFVGEDQLKKLEINPSGYLRLANPIASHQTLLRQDLAPNLFNNIKDNQGKFDRVAIFEIGNVYLSSEGAVIKDSAGKEFLPYQEKRLGIVLALSSADVFRKVKGIIDYLLLGFDLEASYKKSEFIFPWAEKNICADIVVNKKIIGAVVQLSSACANKLNIKRPVVIAEINFRELFNLFKASGQKKYKAIAKYPVAVRDLAFVVDANILYNDIRKELVDFSETVKEVELFDVYEGGKLGAGKKSLAFHIVYQADRTLTSEEVDKTQEVLIGKLEKKLGAKIRNF
jgi:phenylalanyl-tRNA synthetase beta chain